MADPFNLERFVLAQAPVITDVLCELRAGQKRTHWMWFVFPQLRSLGLSARAQFYGISALAEAEAYAAHALLGPRLIACATVIRDIQGRSAQAIFGSPDDMKLRSSMSLFAAAAPGIRIFGEVLGKYYAGQPDPRTVALLAGPTPRDGPP